MDFILANPQIRWSGEGLSMNPNITMSDVLAFPTEIPNNGVNPHYLANPQIRW